MYYGNGTVLSRGVDPALALESANNILIITQLSAHSVPWNPRAANPRYPYRPMAHAGPIDG